MATFGFRLFAFRLTKVRSYDELQFDDPALGPQGARGLLEEIAKECVQPQGDLEDSSSTYFRLDACTAARWLVACQSSGGAYGEERRVVDTATHTPKTGIAASDAVLTDMTQLFVVPSYGTAGVVVSEVTGRSHLTQGLIRRLNSRLAKKNLRLRLEANVADEVAWGEYLDDPDVLVDSVELVQRSNGAADRTRLADSKSVRSARLTIKLGDDPTAKKNILTEARKRFGRGQKANLTGLVGIKVYDDNDFDEQTIVYIQDGREKRIKVDTRWPIFIHQLDYKGTKPTDVELLAGSEDAVSGVLQELGVEKPGNWWPSATELSAG